MTLVAGVDSSTQSTKVVVVDVDDGTVVAEGRAAHDVTGSDGARETDPDQWWAALRTALAATGRAADVTAIAVGGQQHGLVVLDERDRVVRPAKLWNDTQSAPQAVGLVEAFGAPWWASHVGVVPVASFTASKWQWLREHEPDNAARAATVCLPHDFLNLRLTGEAVTDRSDASGTAWWSTRTGRHVDQVLDHVDLDPATLPRTADGVQAGVVTPAAAEALGLRASIPVGAGAGDNAAAALGLGVAPGMPVVSLGTSGTAFAVSRRPVQDASGLVAGFADATEWHLPLAATLNATLAVDRMAQLLGLDRDDAATDTDVVVLPYLDGERSPDLPAAAGSVLGVRHTTTPEQILWATYLGAARSLVLALERIDEVSSGLQVGAPITVVGGGARGTTWQRALRVLSGRALRLPRVDELVAFGAAAQAAATLSGQSPYEIARAWSDDARTVDPLPVDHEARDRIDAVAELVRPLNETPWPATGA